MKDGVTVVSFLGEFDKVFASFRDNVGMKLEIERAFVRHESQIRFLLYACVPCHWREEKSRFVRSRHDGQRKKTSSLECVSNTRRSGCILYLISSSSIMAAVVCVTRSIPVAVNDAATAPVE